MSDRLTKSLNLLGNWKFIFALLLVLVPPLFMTNGSISIAKQETSKIIEREQAPSIVVLGTTATAIAALHKQEQAISADDRQKPADEKQWPIVEYSDSDSSTAENHNAARAARKNLYNKSHLGVVKPSGDEVKGILISDWEIGFPAIPVNLSEAVVMAEVLDSQAHLSGDKTGVYSEFTVRVDEVLKARSDILLTIGNSIQIERLGGRVKFDKGIVRYSVSKQGMPRVNRRYLFFLKQEGQEDFSILTGYELRAGRVFPVDGASVEGGEKTAFDAYADSDEVSFLKAVREAIRQLQER